MTNATSTAISTTVLCPRCRRSVTLAENVKAAACPHCGAKVASEGKAGTK